MTLIMYIQKTEAKKDSTISIDQITWISEARGSIETLVLRGLVNKMKYCQYKRVNRGTIKINKSNFTYVCMCMHNV